MKICFLLSSLGGSPLQSGLERGLCQLGHSVEYYRPGATFDLLVVFNMTAHTQNYVYPLFPLHWRGPTAFVDTGEYGYFRRLPGVIRDYANAFAPKSLTHDTKNEREQLRLKQFLEGRSFPYFLREFSKHIDFPESYWPIDYPLYHLSVCDERPNREEYLRRDLDLFCWWGMSHPWRVNLTQSLRDAHTKCEIGDRWTDENMNQGRYFQRMKAAKCSVSFDGYGSGSFRMTEVLCRTLLLQGPLSIKTRAPLEDGRTCVEFGIDADGETFCGTDIQRRLWEALGDAENSFSIYERGYHHCMEFLTEKATAAYLLETVAVHDWTKPTQLDIGG